MEPAIYENLQTTTGTPKQGPLVSDGDGYVSLGSPALQFWENLGVKPLGHFGESERLAQLFAHGLTSCGVNLGCC